MHWEKITDREKTQHSSKKPSKIKENTLKKLKKILNQEPKIGASNPNSVLCTDQAPSPAFSFSALNPGSALNPRTLNPGTAVYV